MHRLHHGNTACRPGVDDRGRQLEIYIIKVDDIRLKMPDHPLHLFFCLKGIDDMQRIQHLLHPCLMKILVDSRQSERIAHRILFIIHAEVLYLMSPAG